MYGMYNWQKEGAGYIDEEAHVTFHGSEIRKNTRP